jgi:hypothetical protein
MRRWFMSNLYYTNTLGWIFIELAHWKNSPWIDMSLHSANQTLLNAVCIAGLTKPGEVGDFFALVSMKSSNFCQKAKF